MAPGLERARWRASSLDQGDRGTFDGQKASTLARMLIRRRSFREQAPRPRTLLIVLLSGLLLLGGCGIGVAGGARLAYTAVMRDLPKAADLKSRPMAQVTSLYDRTGAQLLYEFYVERRFWVDLRDVSPVMIRATLAAEDVSFYTHPGYDVRGIIRAVVNDLTRRRSGTQGGSTITQQLVKRLLLSSEQTYIRKMRELVLAVQVEEVYSKDEVLELYLNQVFYGNQSYGIEAAALSYFDKHASDLNLAEATILAGLVQAPSDYDPVINPKAALDRQDDVLSVMVRYQMVTQAEADEARLEAEAFAYKQLRTDIKVPHFAFFAREQLSRRVDPEALRGGLSVITTIDLAQQQMAQDIVTKRVAGLKSQRVNNGALAAINPRTGEILAMVGSVDFNNAEIDGQVNVATSLRQPGSAFKPLAFAALFATRKFLPATTVIDEAITRPDASAPSGIYRPVNYDGKFHGTVTLRSALANSYNIPALLVQETIGTKELVRFARALGIVTPLPEVESLTLGAGTVRLLDMVGAYAAFANDGIRVDPTPFLRISSKSGTVIWDATEVRGERVLPSEAAYMVTSVLSENRARYPMFGTVLDLAGGRIAAVKTGTTNDYKDSLTIGYTPSLVVGVWVGNTDSKPMMQVAGSLGAGGIWKEFMDTWLKGQPQETFPMPATVRTGMVCGVPELLYIGAPPPQCGIAGAGPVRTPRPTPDLPPA